MKSTLLFLFLLLFGAVVQAQNYTISGYFDDSETGEKLIAANLFEVKSGDGATSNTYGFYSLTLPKGEVELVASYLGYQAVTKKIMLDKDLTINFTLTPNSVLEEVVVVAEKTKKIQKETQMSQVSVPVEQIEKIPALLGEVDVLKVLQLLPGVQSGGEGQSGMYVRGGSPDQNLILLDGVPVYNVSHLLGFFSVFNSDAIKNVTLTKGGFPARYGGRLSSVVEINMKEGNSKEFHGEGSIGLISSRLTLEGPIKKEKTSFMISGRRTYADLIAKPFIRAASQNSDTKVKMKLYFYDLNAKINHQFNDKHRVYLSAYSGSDVFSTNIRDNGQNGNYFIEKAGIDWGNVTTAARWNYKISNKLFANTTLTYSQFKFDFGVGEEDSFDGELSKVDVRYFSGINDWAGKVDFDFIPNPNHYIRFGLGDTYHTYHPGALSVNGQDGNDPLKIDVGQDKRFSHEYYGYVEDDIKWGALKANIGVHLSGFREKKAHYFYPQPRIGLRYLLNNNWSLKGSFTTMAQYINLLTNESLSLPTDLWVPSTKKIKPQTSWQAALGAATTIHDDFEVSLEAYYKKMKNVVSYKEGATFVNLEESWEDKIEQGFGTAYGTELLIQKKFGRTTGWLGYTLSWNKRQFDNINSGKEFPFKYDRRHDVEIVVSHQVKERVNVSATWVYGTGNAISLPVAGYRGYVGVGYNGTPYVRTFDVLGEKNSFRMGAYHRLDLGVEFTKKKRWGERAWVFSIYNAYNHKNPFFIYL
ncbi:MAG TPA: TonB-dependent receptor, partial [Saprospiraceae bacterium]|nr:TonB-dependent receptor [Saprospiraceae bacterium]